MLGRTAEPGRDPSRRRQQLGAQPAGGRQRDALDRSRQLQLAARRLGPDSEIAEQPEVVVDVGHRVLLRAPEGIDGLIRVSEEDQLVGAVGDQLE